MKSYSRSLSTRSRWLALFALLLLALAAAWQHAPRQGETLFTPEQRIREVIAAGSALQSPPPENGAAERAQVLPCDGRALQVLQAHLMASLQVDAARAQQQIARAASQNAWTDCPHFTQAFHKAIQMTLGGPFSAASVKEALTEDVSWDRRVPCLLGGSDEQPLLLAGHPMHCGLQGALSPLSSLPATSSFRQQAASLASAATMAAVSGRWSPTPSQRISLQPALQAPLDAWSACIQAQACPQTPELLHVRDAALVVLDAQTGTLLATWCHGTACQRAQQQGPGVLPATLVEVPPASTAKLLFAMAIAADKGSDAALLQKQIKTSGQNDGSVSKRNEWWEKQAICDDAPGQRCRIPGQTRQIAEGLGWNAHCKPASPGCGRWGLLQAERPDVLPGQIGRLALDKLPDAGAAMLDWKRYDEIRQGKRKPEGARAYANSSLAIQAVIGAGDSRISALGLAALPMQIWRLSQGLPAALPSVLSTPAPAPLPPPDKAWRQAASTVLGGMRKVVQPAEAGWQGAGTAAPAWLREMKKPCDGACGVWAKTGTVGKSDKVFGGTTTFAALLDTQEWGQWGGQEPPEALKNKVLSIGVLAMPDARGPRMHDASFLGMSAIRQLMAVPKP